jgi:TonB family protein
MDSGTMAAVGRHPHRARRSNRMGLALTLAVHGGVIAAVGIAHSRPAPTPIDRRTFVSAEMVTLGKRPHEAPLPRVPAPRVMPPAKVLGVVDDPDGRPARPEAPDLPDSRVADPVNAHPGPPVISPPDEMNPGVPDESAFGTSDRNAGERYLAEITGRLLQNYSLSAGLTADQLASPPRIRFRFTDDGTIVDVTITKSSGNPLVDDACLDAARLTRQIPAPPASFPGRAVAVSCER